jgi:DNA-binding transcriptional regulator YiaG
VAPNRRFDAEKIEQLRQRRAAGVSVRVLAAELGVSTQRVYRLLRPDR